MLPILNACVFTFSALLRAESFVKLVQASGCDNLYSSNVHVAYPAKLKAFWISAEHTRTEFNRMHRTVVCGVKSVESGQSLDATVRALRMCVWHILRNWRRFEFLASKTRSNSTEGTVACSANSGHNLNVTIRAWWTAVLPIQRNWRRFKFLRSNTGLIVSTYYQKEQSHIKIKPSWRGLKFQYSIRLNFYHVMPRSKYYCSTLTC